MLLVDYREGSDELREPLQRMGLPAERGDIPADLFWEGRGEKGAAVTVAVEFKKLDELVQAMRTQRLQGHQLLKMRKNFDFCYLLVEGELHLDAKGRLCKRTGRRTFRPIHGGMSVSELFKRLLVLHLCGGLNLLFARTRTESLQWIAALYRTWTDCNLDEHGSHIAIYQAPMFDEISEFRQFFTRIDGIGLRASKAIEDHFRDPTTGQASIRRAVNAPQAEWLTIRWKSKGGRSEGIGPSLAAHITNVLEGTDGKR